MHAAFSGAILAICLPETRDGSERMVNGMVIEDRQRLNMVREDYKGGRGAFPRDCWRAPEGRPAGVRR
jgi:hypothetical protein